MTVTLYDWYRWCKRGRVVGAEADAEPRTIRPWALVITAGDVIRLHGLGVIWR